MGSKKKIIIVEDHPIVRQGLKTIIEEENDLEICGETGNANEAIRIISKLNPDLVLVDISLEGNANGLDLVKSMHKRYPAINALVMSMHDDKIYAERAIMAGAKGYIMKSEVSDDIINAIRSVLNNELYLKASTSLNIVSKVFQNSSERSKSSIDRLTDREFEILTLLGKGLGTRKIAHELNISVNTVETHRRHIRKKLDLKDSDELVSYAIQWYLDSRK
ncbi:MAG: response regulator transcription factor [Spirochaetes bacterium]|nr:response regulator transcription factor [Spirochaetota bacterium]